MRQTALVFLGSGFGGAARYLFALGVGRLFGTAFPYGTIAINAIGSFLIVIIMELSTAGRISVDTRLLLTTGIMGGFTTYSTFNYETIAFLQQGGWLLGALNLAITVVLCLAAGLLGLWVARQVV